MQRPLFWQCLLACLVVLVSRRHVLAATGSSICDWRLGIGKDLVDPLLAPEGINSYIIKCAAQKDCGEVAKALLTAQVDGQIGGLRVLRSLGMLTGEMSSSFVKWLCANDQFNDVISMMELDQVVKYDSVI
eukprot:jgi/Picsp_1/2874/NSC_01099-R1_---NA---